MEGCLFFILLLHEDLVITFVCIEKTFKRIPCERINLEINFRERVAIFWTSLVKIFKIYTHSPRVVGFSDHNRISNP
ncbi:hypothetical protein Hanom_Chr02g00147021 [Helianthus anomalus]